MVMQQFNPQKLPEFQGYTVDTRLRQYRQCVLGQLLEFFDFDSPEGRALRRAGIDFEQKGAPGQKTEEA